MKERKKWAKPLSDMTLQLKIEDDFKQALKKKREAEVSALRMLKAAIFNREKEKRYKISQEKPDFKNADLEKESVLTDEEIHQLIFSEIKKCQEALILFEKGQREDLVKKETKEIEILKKYLPEQLSEGEIKKIIKEIIENVGAKDIKDMGRVMKELMPRLKGQAEGSAVSKIVRDLLS